MHTHIYLYSAPYDIPNQTILYVEVFLTQEFDVLIVDPKCQIKYRTGICAAELYSN